MNINHLSVSWSISRGRDTYGYNICRLDDRAAGKRYRCMGGGYDMIGTVFGEWLQERYQERLFALFNAAELKPTVNLKHPDYYGATMLAGTQSVHLDGACGIESMIRIAEAIGLEVQRESRSGSTLGFFIQDTKGQA